VIQNHICHQGVEVVLEVSTAFPFGQSFKRMGITRPQEGLINAEEL
jgi:hypothetical protein